jgi:hypothetical protein
MPAGSVIGIAGGVVAILCLAFVFGVVVPTMMRHSWGRWHAPFPPVEPAPGAVRRRFQSFSVGMVNLGCGVHVAVDDAYLHLTPGFLAAPFGARPVSIPWDQVEVKGSFPIRQRRARIAGVPVVGPAWCLDLAGRPDRGGEPV